MMENQSPKYVTKKAVQNLVQKLKLPPPDKFSQDWEYEVSDASRINDFLYAYDTMGLDRDEKFALMIIIISSWNDALMEGSADDNEAKLFRYHLLQDIEIHKHTICYWSLLDEDELENWFPVTSFMRQILYDANLDE